ncbi:hypothetical protein Acr_00g0078050 [Actinidia rufa]|uniref:Uncharacterized protein n=1 Tax=Actinidia rufa TaxID=165716 RepID=A0A7J0DV95_9ERIC|nr:hypothetical protein Acr_00g0078050 [Actinidia rufa]
MPYGGCTVNVGDVVEMESHGDGGLRVMGKMRITGEVRAMGDVDSIPENPSLMSKDFTPHHFGILNLHQKVILANPYPVSFNGVFCGAQGTNVTDWGETATNPSGVEMRPRWKSYNVGKAQRVRMQLSFMLKGAVVKMKSHVHLILRVDGEVETGGVTLAM